MLSKFAGVTRKYHNVIVLALGTAALTFGFSIWSEFLTPYLLNIYGTFEAMFGYSDWLTSFVFALILPIALLPVMGSISDRFGRKWIIVTALLVYSAVTLLYPTVVVFPYFYLFVIAGILQTILLPAFRAMTADSVNSEARGRAFGTVVVASSLPSVVAPALAGAVFRGSGFQGVFSLGAVVVLSGAVTCLLFLVEPNKPRSTQGRVARDFDSRREESTCNDPSLASVKKDAKSIETMPELTRRGWRTTIISLIAITILFSLIPVFVNSMLPGLFPYGVDLDLVYSLNVLFPLISTSSIILAAVWTDSKGRKRTLLEILKVVLVLSLLVSPLQLWTELWYLIAVQCIITFIVQAISIVTLAWVADITPSSRRGLTYGILAACFEIGQLALAMLSSGTLYIGLYYGSGPIVFAVTLITVVIAMKLAKIGLEEPKAKY